MTITLNAMKKLGLKKHGLLKKCKGDFDCHMKFFKSRIMADELTKKSVFILVILNFFSFLLTFSHLR